MDDSVHHSVHQAMLSVFEAFGLEGKLPHDCVRLRIAKPNQSDLPGRYRPKP